MQSPDATGTIGDWLRPTWKRGIFATILAIGGFFFPQEVPLEWYPLNNPGSDINYLEISCAVDKNGEVQIYYDLGTGINEFDSIRFPISPTERTFTYTFPLPDAPITAIRLDPVNQGAQLTIRQMRIINRREELIHAFTRDSFHSLRQIADISALPEGWKITSIPTAYDASAQLALPGPIIPVGMNRRNLLRCLLSTGYLAGMLFIILMAVLTATLRPRGWRDFFIHAGFMASLALLFAPVGNRGLIKNSLRYAAYTPPPNAIKLILAMDVSTDTPTTAQLYWDLGEGLSEELSSKQFLQSHSAQQTLRFPLPMKQIQHLRFDPLVNEGRLAIFEMRLIDAAGRMLATLPGDSLQPENEIAALESRGKGAVITTAPDSRDPTTRFTAAAVTTINRHQARVGGNGSEEQTRGPSPR